MIAAESYIGLLTDPAHVGVELTIEALTFLAGLLYGRVWLRRHDAKHHAPVSRSAPFSLLRDLSALTQRVERVEAQLDHPHWGYDRPRPGPDGTVPYA